MNKIILLLLLPLMTYSKQKADLIIEGKIIYTANQRFDTASAMAIRSGKIIAIGSISLISQQYVAEKHLFARDKFIYPGFIDAHCHFSGYAQDGYKCELTDVPSYDELINKLSDYEKRNTLGWIYGRGWDQNIWKVKEFPSNERLNMLFPDKPVILKRIDGHAILCNQKALDKAGITLTTQIAGGIIEQKNGKLTGILIDNAMNPVENIIPPLPEEQFINYLNRAEKECYSYGLTGVVDCGVKSNVISLLQRLYISKELTIGNSILLSNDKETLEQYLDKGPQRSGQLNVTGIKLYADGALGSRGACLIKDYSDMPGHRGLLLTEPKRIKEIANEAIKYNWQVCTHAIGDSANRVVLEIYGSVLKTKNERRWRIEHAQVVDYHDYSTFGKYSIVPSVQPTHATSDMLWAERRLGSVRLPEAYAYKALLKENGWIALGTDFPVEAIDPLATFYSAVARKDKNGNPSKGFLPENALTRKEALKGMTLWAAKSVFTDKDKGSLEIGKDADIIILDQDIMTIPEKDILSTKIVYTLVKGEIKYRQ